MDFIIIYYWLRQLDHTSTNNLPSYTGRGTSCTSVLRIIIRRATNFDVPRFAGNSRERSSHPEYQEPYRAENITTTPVITNFESSLPSHSPWEPRLTLVENLTQRGLSIKIYMHILRTSNF